MFAMALHGYGSMPFNDDVLLLWGYAFLRSLTASKKSPPLSQHQFLRHSAQVPEKAHQSRDRQACANLGRPNAIVDDMARGGLYLGVFGRGCSAPSPELQALLGWTGLGWKVHPQALSPEIVNVT